MYKLIQNNLYKIENIFIPLWYENKIPSRI